MTNTPARQSPIQHLLQPQGGEWTDVGDAPLALRFQPADVEASAAQTLALCDISALPKLGVKGPAASDWLQAQGVAVPAEIYDTQELADGGRIARIASDEFLLQSGMACQIVPVLSEKLGQGQDGAIRVERQEATFLLVGSCAVEVFAQTCGIDIRGLQPHRLLMTRIAGASCSILHCVHDGVPIYQISVDPTYAVYLWETLLEISTQLGGHVIGAATVLCK